MKFELSTYPETMSHLLGRSFSLYRHVFVRVFLLSLLLSIIASIPQIIAAILGHPIFLDQNLFNPHRLWLILVDIGCLTVFTGILWRIRCVLTNTNESMLTDIKVALKKLPYALVAALIQSGLIIGVLLIFVLFSLHYVLYHQTFLIMDLKHELLSGSLLILQFLLISYVYFSLCFYLPIILVENKGIFSSLLESIQLVWGNWWRTMIVQITPWVLYLALFNFIRNFLHLGLNFQNSMIENLLIISFYILCFTIFIPLAASTLMVQLRDLEIRKGMITPNSV